MKPPVGVCAAKDCDVIVCDADSPLLTDNPPRKFEPDRARLDAIVSVSNGAEDLYGTFEGEKVRRILLKVPVTYNNRLTAVIGRCIAVYDRDTERAHPKKIEIAGKLEIPDKYVHGLLVHEFCHAARAVVANDYMDEPGHGLEWKDLMIASGELPHATCLDPSMLKSIRQYEEDRAALKSGRTAVKVAERPQLPRSAFRLGEKIAFYVTKRGVEERLEGVIVKKNPKTAGIYVSGERGRWRVSYHALEKM